MALERFTLPMLVMTLAKAAGLQSSEDFAPGFSLDAGHIHTLKTPIGLVIALRVIEFQKLEPSQQEVAVEAVLLLAHGICGNPKLNTEERVSVRGGLIAALRSPHFHHASEMLDHIYEAIPFSPDLPGEVEGFAVFLAGVISECGFETASLKHPVS